MKPTHKWMPVIDEDRCSGCGLCVHACGPACLTMPNAFAVLALPEACGSEEHCIGVCGDDAIRMAWLPWTGDTSRGKWKAQPAALRPGFSSPRQRSESTRSTNRYHPKHAAK